MDYSLYFDNKYFKITLIILPILFSYLLLSAAYKIFRLYYIVAVNCWFCNKNTKVLYDKRNSFNCPSCDQYNGFKEDGDYNREITDQFKENIKNFSYRFGPIQNNNKKKTIFNHAFTNGLCDVCNFNQALKVRSIAEFSESCKDDYEIDTFRKKLDEMYALCKDCEVSLHQVLGIQDSWLKPKLLSWKIHKSKLMKNIPFRNGDQNMWRRVNHLLLSLLAACLVASNVFGCLLHSFPVFTEGIEQPFVIMDNLSKIDVAVATGGLFIVFYHLLRGNYSQKSHRLRLLFSWSLMAASLAYSLQSDTFLSINQLKYCLLTLTVMNFINVVQSSKREITKQRIKESPKMNKPASIISLTATTPEMESVNANHEISDCFDVQSASSSASFNSSVSKSTMIFKEQVVEDNFSLKGLQIGIPKKRSGSKAASIFSLPSSGNSTCKLGKSPKVNVIQPAKFCSTITQASWVAGGVWGGSPRKAPISPKRVSVSRGASQDRDLFSRSSSKSSGFISQLSDVNDLSGWTTCNNSLQDLTPPHSLSSTCRRVPSRQRQHHLDGLDAQSACSLQSFYSSPAPSEREWSSFNSLNSPPVLNTTSKEVQINWFNLCVSFFFGFSLAANVFLCVLYFKSPDVKS